MRWALMVSLGTVGLAAVGCQSTPAGKSDNACDCCTTSARSSHDPKFAASAFALADARVAQPAAMIKGIDEALQVCAANLTHAEETAFRATRADVGGDGDVRFCVDTTQGALEDTRRELDVGIQGDGYFKVKVRDRIGDGFAYTRSGNFFRNSEGELVLGLGDGYKLEPAIALPHDATEITIGQSGRVEYKQQGNLSRKQAGELLLSRFRNPDALSQAEHGLYIETERSGPPMESKPGEEGAGFVLQGFLEASNVNVERERLRIEFLRNWRETIREAVKATPASAR